MSSEMSSLSLSAWTSWGNWTECTRSCGTGRASRARLCQGPPNPTLLIKSTNNTAKYSTITENRENSTNPENSTLAEYHEKSTNHETENHENSTIIGNSENSTVAETNENSTVTKDYENSTVLAKDWDCGEGESVEIRDCNDQPCRGMGNIALTLTAVQLASMYCS